jgi:acyl-CoA dehydrogenase
MLLTVLDRAIQAHGAAGISQDFPLAGWYARGRTLRFADGPDEVHIAQIGKVELRRAEGIKEKFAKQEQASAKLLANNKSKL